MIIPPKLKILAGFKADDDVTIEQIIAALEKQNLRQPATQISNVRQKFQSLMNEREQEFPDEAYDARFVAVATSDKGQQLLTQMARPESAEENLGNQFSDQAEKAPLSAAGSGFGGFKSKEEAKQTFMAHVEELQGKGLNRNVAWSTAAATEPGKSAYLAWKTLAAAERPEIVRTPPSQPSDAAILKAREALQK